MRTATALVGVPVVLAIDYLGGLPFAGLIGLAAAVGSFEFYRLTRAGRYHPAMLFGLVASVAVAVLPFVTSRPQTPWIGILVALVALTGIWYLAPPVYGESLGGWLSTIGGVLYVGLLLGQLSLLRVTRDGAWWVLAALVITWAYDTGAYFAGSRLGKHPFMHHVSPKKTTEGVGGGLLLSTLAGLVTVPTVGLAPWQGLLIGLLGGAAAQAGDLVESMMKRQVDVKDSGTIVPGHGGLLDRIDGLLFTGALVYYGALIFGYAS